MLNGVKILRDLLVIQAITQKKKGSFGLAMPDETGGAAGKVVAIGPEVKEIDLGSIIYFGNESKTVNIKGHEYIVMESNNVIGIEEENKTL